MSQDEWNFYFRHQGGGTQSIRLDFSLRSQVPIHGMGVCVHAVVHLIDARPDGFPDSNENATLNSIENDLLSSARHAGIAVHVACISGHGVRQIVFYATEAASIAAAVASVRQKFPQYRIDVNPQHDPEWTYYRDTLCPDIAEVQQMVNRDIYDTLKEHGDPMESPREIDHWAYFPSQTALNAFMEKLRVLGFGVRMQHDQVGHGNDGSVATHGVQFFRADVPSPGAFDEVTTELAELAAAEGGEYDGWETEILSGLTRLE